MRAEDYAPDLVFKLPTIYFSGCDSPPARTPARYPHFRQVSHTRTSQIVKQFFYKPNPAPLVLLVLFGALSLFDHSHLE